jgi:hypothetical protein
MIIRACLCVVAAVAFAQSRDETRRGARPKIQSENSQTVRQVVRRAGMLADKVERLRYLRGAVSLVPGALWPHRTALWIIASVVFAAVGVALVLWSKS